MGSLSATAKQWLDDRVTSADIARNNPVVFVARFTLADATVLYSQLSRSPGYRNVTGDAEALPDLILPSIDISILDPRPVKTERGRSKISVDHGQSFDPPLPDANTFNRFLPGMVSYGRLRISNADGSKDSWGDGTYTFSDADFEMLIGTQDLDFGSFEVMYPAKIDGEPGWGAGRGIKRELVFDLSPAHVNLSLPANDEQFTGTGGDEGGADHVGYTKPRAFGTTYSAPVHMGDLRWLVSSEALSAINLVFQSGVTSIAINGVPTGDYTEDAANGGIDFAGPPAGDVAAHVDGEKIDGGAFTAAPEKIIEYFIETLWGGTLDGGTDYGTDFPYACGMPWSPKANLSRAQALGWMLSPLGLGFIDQDGLSFKIQVFKEPSTQSASVAYTDSDIVSITKLSSLPPVYRVGMGYAEKPVPREIFTGNASAIEVWSRPRTLEVAVDAAVQTAYPSAHDVVVPSPLAVGANAATVAAAWLAAYDAPYSIYRVVLGRREMNSWVGDYVSLQSDTEDNLPGFTSAKKVLVTGRKSDFERGLHSMECLGATI